MKWKDLIELNKDIDPEEEVACLLWTRPDVKHILERYFFGGEIYTDEFADDVLREAHRNAMVTGGLTWDNLWGGARDLLRERGLR